MENNKNIYRLIFIGTSEFAIPALKNLIENEKFNIISIITQPDKKVGRKQALTPPPLRKEALKYNIAIWQPDNIAKIKDQLIKLKPDLMIVISYGQIIPKDILNIPKYGSLNVHGSLLPKYRGAACIQAAILNGDKKTGITIIKMDENLDTGPILMQAELKIKPKETALPLHDKLAKLGAKILPNVITDYINDKIKLKKQDQSKSSYIRRISKENGLIDWHKNATDIERMVRALNPWPGTFTKIINKKLKIKNNSILKILEVEHKSLYLNNRQTGEIFLYQGKLAIQCGHDSLIIKKLQLEGKNAMLAEDFLRGNRAIIGTRLK